MSAEVRFLSYREAERLLCSFGVPLAPARLVESPDEAVAAAREVGWPVALKAMSAQSTHKSDAGLVRLQLGSEAAVVEAARELLDVASMLSLEGLLVQAMMPSAVEMIAGISQDVQFGPVLALGAGGILVELLDDLVLRLPPLTREQAGRMIAETRAWPLLQGYRGQPPADVAALADLLVNLSRLAQAEAERLVSLDLNPVMVLPQGEGVQVVDVRVLVRGDEGEEGRRHGSS